MICVFVNRLFVLRKLRQFNVAEDDAAGNCMKWQRLWMLRGSVEAARDEGYTRDHGAAGAQGRAQPRGRVQYEGNQVLAELIDSVNM